MGIPGAAGVGWIFKTKRRDKASGEREVPSPDSCSRPGSRREEDPSPAGTHWPRVGSPFLGVGSITTGGLSAIAKAVWSGETPESSLSGLLEQPTHS